MVSANCCNRGRRHARFILLRTCALSTRTKLHAQHAVTAGITNHFGISKIPWTTCWHDGMVQEGQAVGVVEGPHGGDFPLCFLQPLPRASIDLLGVVGGVIGSKGMSVRQLVWLRPAWW